MVWLKPQQLTEEHNDSSDSCAYGCWGRREQSKAMSRLNERVRRDAESIAPARHSHDSSSNYRPILVLPQIKKISHTVSTLLLSTAWPAGSFGEHGIPMFTTTASWPSSGMYMVENDELAGPAGDQ